MSLDQNKITKYAFLNSAGTALYVVLVAIFLSNAQGIFGPEEDKTVLIPIMMLMLLVLSVTVCGLLVFGRPIMWYWDGKKQEALGLILQTVGFLFLLVLSAFFLLYFSAWTINQ